MNDNLPTQSIDTADNNLNTGTQKQIAIRRSFFIAIAIIIALFGISYAGVILWSKKQTRIANKVQFNNPANVSPKEPWNFSDSDFFIPEFIEMSEEHPVPNVTVNWNKDHKKLENLHLLVGYIDYYNPTSNFKLEDSDVSYYLLGKHGDNDVILGVAPAMDPGGPYKYFFERNQKSQYTFMQLMSSGAYTVSVDSAGYAISNIVMQANTKDFYKQLAGPDNFTYKGLKLVNQMTVLNSSAPYPGDFYDEFIKDQLITEGKAQIKKVDEVPGGDLYLYSQKFYTDDKSVEFSIQKYLLKVPSGFLSHYGTGLSYLNSDNEISINWNDGKKDKFAVNVDGGGCGQYGMYVIAKTDIGKYLTQTGKTSNGTDIYEISDINNPMTLYYYRNSGRSDDTTSWSGMDPLTIKEWFAGHPMLFIKNSLGEYQVLTNQEYVIHGDCGKPVVYLYPTVPTKVSVKVGADVKISEPNYDKGWLVNAEPSGKLTTMDGKHHDSLYWEGKGKGIYPVITEGIIAKKDNIEQTLRDNLNSLGLNAKESQDFIDFWLPKMPHTPYVRLTWFTTKQLDGLAPLYISPKPDSIIRVFLDFQGLDKPVNLPEQKLSSITRSGFTVIEWGGLLR